MISRPPISLAALAVTVMVVLNSHGCVGQPETTTTTTTTQQQAAAAASGSGGGTDSGIIIGGQYGLFDKLRRRARSDKKADGASSSMDDLMKKRRNRGFRKFMKKAESLDDIAQEGEGSEDEEGLNAEELMKRIELLGNANKRTLEQAQAEEDSASGRFRGLARRYFGNVGRNFINIPERVMGIPSRLTEGVGQAVGDMARSVNDVLRILPYDQIGDIALRVAGYFQNMIDTGVPQALLDRLLNTRVGGFSETMDALLSSGGDTSKLEPILEDIAANYRRYFSDTAGELEKFLTAILPAGMSLPSVPVITERTTSTRGVAVGEPDPNTPVNGIAVGEINPDTPINGFAVGEPNPNAPENAPTVDEPSPAASNDGQDGQNGMDGQDGADGESASTV